MDTDEFSTDAFHGRDWKCAWMEGGGERGVVENIKGGRKVLVRATC